MLAQPMSFFPPPPPVRLFSPFFPFQFASGDFVFLMDADLSHHPKNMLDFIKRQRETGADIVTGTRCVLTSFSIIFLCRFIPLFWPKCRFYDFVYHMYT